MRYVIAMLVLAVTANAAAEGRDRYEVWAINQSNSPGKAYGGTLYIWDGHDLENKHRAPTAEAEKIDLGGAAAERLLRRRGERAEAHPGDRHGNIQLERLRREARPEDDVGRTALAITLERVARDRCAEEEQVIKVRQPALGAESADVVDPLGRGALDLGDDGAVEEVRLAQVPGSLLGRGHQ